MGWWIGFITFPVFIIGGDVATVGGAIIGV